MIESLLQVVGFVALLAVLVVALELYLHAHFTQFDKRWFLPGMALGVPALALAGIFFSTEGRPDPGWTISLIGGLCVAEFLVALFFRYYVRGKHSLPIMMLAPGLLGLILLIVYPLIFEVYLAFHDLKLTTVMAWSGTGALPFVGFKQFCKVFVSSPLSGVTFFQLFLRTVWWTFINVVCHVVGGFALAILLNNQIRFKGIYRTFLVIPWAMPQVVAVLALRGEFHSQYGFINVMITRLLEWLPWLSRLGAEPVQWLSFHPLLTCTLINIWLGIPFMMVIILGGLQSISRHYYDAAAIDGASAFQQFRLITLPLLRPVLAPAITLGSIWTFNNINVIYLVTGQAGGTEDADILVSALYKAAFTYYRYSYSAAFAIVIFLILFTLSLLWVRYSKGTESAYG